MGYNIFNVKQVKPIFKTKLDAFIDSLGPALKDGTDITFADNDLTYSLQLQHERLADKGLDMDYEVYLRDAKDDVIHSSANWKDAHYESTMCFKNVGLRRTINKDGKKVYKDNRRSVVYEILTDVHEGTKPENENICCPNCSAVSTIAELQNGCPFCGTRYMMDDLFPKVTSYYFLEDVGMSGKEGKKEMVISMIASTLVLYLIALIVNLIKLPKPITMEVIKDNLWGGIGLAFVLTIFGVVTGYIVFSFYLILRLIIVGSKEAGKIGTVGSRNAFESRMKRISPEFSFEYFTSKAVSLIKTAVFAKNEQDLLFYTGMPMDKKMKNIIDLNYGGALGLAAFQEKDGVCTAITDVFFDVLYADDKKVYPKRQVFRAAFQRRTDIPINMNFSMTRIQCPTCGKSFDATKNKYCPSCGNVYNIASDDWTLVEVKYRK